MGFWKGLSVDLKSFEVLTFFLLCDELKKKPVLQAEGGSLSEVIDPSTILILD